MEYKVGSLADMISNSSSSKKTKRLSKKQASDETLGVGLGQQIKFEKIQTPIPSTPKVGKNKRKRDLSVDLDKTQTLKKKHLKQKVRFSVEDNEAKQIDDKKVPDLNQEKRTIFVGNLSKTTTKFNLKNLFRKYGTVETVRLRSASVEDIRVPKKVAIIRGTLHPQRSSINAYVRFTTVEAAYKALACNGTVVKDHTLRVDIATNKDNFDQKKTVFVGNLKFAVEEDDLRKVFENCGEIICVRLVRDNKTGMGKGFGFINFNNSAAVELALKLNGEELDKRPLRVTRCEKQSKSLGKMKKNKPRKKRPTQLKAKLPVLDGDSECPVENNERSNVAKKIKSSNIDLSDFQGERINSKKSKKKKKKIDKGELKKKVMLSKLGIKPMPKKVKKVKFTSEQI